MLAAMTHSGISLEKYQRTTLSCYSRGIYPIFSEDDYSSRVMNAAYSYWENASIPDRVYECQRARVSIFASRRNSELPDRLMERLEQIAEE
jgi:hypothetical protein